MLVGRGGGQLGPLRVCARCAPTTGWHVSPHPASFVEIWGPGERPEDYGSASLRSSLTSEAAGE
jgi:hypothetical protein